MKRLLYSAGFIVLMVVFYGCAQPAFRSAQAATNRDPGILIFQSATTFQPGACVQIEQLNSLVTSSSSINTSWDRDSLGTAASQSAYLRPTADVGSGAAYFTFCNYSLDPITVPAGARVLFEIMNAGLPS